MRTKAYVGPEMESERTRILRRLATDPAVSDQVRSMAKTLLSRNLEARHSRIEQQREADRFFTVVWVTAFSLAAVGLLAVLLLGSGG